MIEIVKMQTPKLYSPSPNCLAKKIIIVTGAGDGIGRVAAKTFAAHGATLVLVGRTLAKLEKVYDEIEAAGHAQPAIYPINFASATEVEFIKMCDAIHGEFKHIDGILHNAADLGQSTSITNYAVDAWTRCMQVNLNAPFMLTKIFMPLLQNAENASVVFTGSSVGYQGRSYWGAYAASKAAAENLMQTLAEELQETTKIRVNSINPGATRTKMRAAAFPGEDPTTVKPPEDLMRDYLYLMDNASVGITGQQFEVITN
jgi:NAD(P)-dependent dehydrogenase (short-subunit alcohol dehydrogenase family)